MKQIMTTGLMLLVIAIQGKPTNNQFRENKTTEIMQKEENQKIEALLSLYKRSLNTSDARLAQSLYTKNGVFMPTEAPSAVGIENILKSYEFIFSQIRLNIDFYIEEIEVEGDMAVAVTSSKGTTLIHATGDTIQEANRELFVFEKEDGHWKIARYMFNKTEPKK
ncbi:MAG: nuclear transport factor 2 family protein [Cyclobacteriaceae bacterium]